MGGGGGWVDVGSPCAAALGWGPVVRERVHFVLATRGMAKADPGSGDEPVEVGGGTCAGMPGEALAFAFKRSRAVPAALRTSSRWS